MVAMLATITLKEILEQKTIIKMNRIDLYSNKTRKSSKKLIE
jgi:hypothetical protein